jgi:riboflavin kinase/FMN adenylyltransferase
MNEAGLKAYITEEITFEEKTISSTLIRKELADGNIAIANRLLGTPYFLSGVVESGNRVGKKLGFPTINIPLREGYVELGRGVYFTLVKIGDKFYRGITNVGTCPTFDERKMHTETYILDYNGEIYGEEVKLFFLEYIREERKFESPEELRAEIGRNMKWAMEREIKWQEIGLK